MVADGGSGRQQLAAPRRLPAYILAGGHARRFGSDKARALLDDRPLLLHVAEALRPCASALTVVAERPDKYADLGLRTIADSRRLGPLDGLLAAIADLPPSCDWLLLCSCDLLGLQPRWIDALAAATARPGVAAAAFRAQQWEPLPALYHRQVAPAARRLLEHEQHALWRLLQQVESAALARPADWSRSTNVNTVSDLRALQPAAPAPPDVDK